MENHLLPGYLHTAPSTEEKLEISLNYNFQVDEKPELKGFCLRLTEKAEGIRLSGSREMGVYLSVEEWKAVISSMQAQLALAEEAVVKLREA